MLRLMLALLLFAPLPALAQTVRTTPFGTVTANLSGTITLTGTFQSIQVANSERKSCLIQNNSASNNMRVYFGPVASATSSNSVTLSPSSTVNCTAGGIVLTDQVSITGTTGDAFLANFQ